mmetsp:Transcript_34736/g.111583  ORF Transcript_34736/g.111583 Transcript_34736/m.111583 type:complete len:204 (-) Transcript_34736:864-1475(-)
MGSGRGGQRGLLEKGEVRALHHHLVRCASRPALRLVGWRRRKGAPDGAGKEAPRRCHAHGMAGRLSRPEQEHWADGLPYRGGSMRVARAGAEQAAKSRSEPVELSSDVVWRGSTHLVQQRVGRGAGERLARPAKPPGQVAARQRVEEYRRDGGRPPRRELAANLAAEKCAKRKAEEERPLSRSATAALRAEDAIREAHGDGLH